MDLNLTEYDPRSLALDSSKLIGFFKNALARIFPALSTHSDISRSLQFPLIIIKRAWV